MAKLLEPISDAELNRFLQKLSTRNVDDFTKQDYKLIFDFIDSDGCTCVADFYLDACTEHDFYYRTHRDFFGNPISFSEANARFRRRIQKNSRFGVLSPMSYWRWMGVAALGRLFWKEELPTTITTDKVIENTIKLPWQKDA